MTNLRIACMSAAAAVALLVAGSDVLATSRAHAIPATVHQSSSSASETGGITGKVYFHGTPPQLRPILMDKDPVCASEQSGTVLPEDGRVNTNGTLPNAFVYVEKGPANLSAAVPATQVTLTQNGCVYEPHVLGIVVGQTLQVVTSDPTTHNIHVMPKGSRSWNVTQQPGSQPITSKFSHPEIMVPVRCNIHPWMEAYIGVVSNPYFAVTGNDGSFQIQGLPPGDYTLDVWVASFGTQQRQITVRPGEKTSIDFAFTGQ
jgi:plastocyanin